MSEPEDRAESSVGEHQQLNLQPITQSEAFAFIEEHHSTHDAPQGWKFGVAVNDGERVVGVAVVGRPVSRHRQDGSTLEVTRCATDGTPNAASKLYAAAWRAAKNLGYRRLITYTLADSEDGVPLQAVDGYRVLHERTGGGDWSRPSRPRVDTSPEEQKTLWEAVEPDNPTPDDLSHMMTDGGAE